MTPDDAPELTYEMLDVAEFTIGGKLIRPATGYHNVQKNMNVISGSNGTFEN
ncbi:hypothetical protein [Sphingomonas sp. Leaf339]|uniref:hypothetical protein n=1 Tax=Sphingomonas sp. Leaf339 TaxID=1736343 RepID=UPI000B0776BF|nr:hypothetical protein [Sphingomonas sp. Leaf339]